MHSAHAYGYWLTEPFPTVGMGFSPRAWELVWVLKGEGDPCFLAGDLFTDIMSTLTIRQPIIGLIAKLYLSFIGASHAVQKLHMLFSCCPRVTYADLVLSKSHICCSHSVIRNK